MARNAYTGLRRRLATHPAFSRATGTLRCPFCEERFSNVKPYEEHFLAHDPRPSTAERWLSAQGYRHAAAARGWALPGLDASPVRRTSKGRRIGILEEMLGTEYGKPVRLCERCRKGTTLPEPVLRCAACQQRMCVHSGRRPVGARVCCVNCSRSTGECNA